MKTKLSALILLIALLLSAGIAAAQTTRNTVSLGNITAAAGSSGTMTLDLANQDSVAGGEFSFSFDTTKGLTITTVQAASRLSGFTFTADQNVNGSVVTIHGLFYNLNSLTVAPGSGAIVTMNYSLSQAATGQTVLDLTQVLLSDIGGNPLTAGMTDGSVTVPAAGFACSNVSEIPQGECNALVALYNSTGGANWINKTGWLQTNTPCSWFGVTCNLGHVVAIGFGDPNNNIVGPIPTEIGNLTELDAFGIIHNKITALPTSFFNIPKLRYVNLLDNQISGAIPASVCNATNLENLYIQVNQLTGSIPACLNNLTNLKALALNTNQLTGSIPNLSNLKQLETLNIEVNNFSAAPMPTWLNTLTNLRHLVIKHTGMTGAILDLSGLKNLEWLILSENALTGSVPTWTCSLPNLTILGIDGTQLQGNLPDCMPDSLTKLQDFTYSTSQVCVPATAKFETWLKAVPNLYYPYYQTVWCQSSTANLLNNGGFEQGAAGWTLDGTAQLTTGVKYSGNNAIYSEQTLTGTTNLTWQGIYQTTTITGGGFYNLSAMLNWQNVSNLHMKVEFYDANNQYITMKVLMYGTNGTSNGWVKEGAPFIAPANAKKAKVYIWHGLSNLQTNIAGGVVLIDEVNLTAVNCPDYTLCDGNFEQGFSRWYSYATVTLAPTSSYNGTTALRTEQTNQANQPPKWSGLRQIIKVKPNQVYEANLRVKLENVTRFHYKVDWFDSNETYLSTSSAVWVDSGSTNGWEQKGGLVTAHANADHAEITIWHGVIPNASNNEINVSGGVAWLDDIVFQPANLLINSDFEQQGLNWGYYLTATTFDTGRNGSQYALKSTQIFTDDGLPKWVGVDYIPITVTAGQNYYYDLYCKGQNAVNVHGKIDYYNAANETVGTGFTAFCPDGTYDWTQAGGVTIAPPGAVQGIIRIWHGVTSNNQTNAPNGILWLDDVTFKPTTPLTCSGNVCNPNFENDLVYWVYGLNTMITTTGRTGKGLVVKYDGGNSDIIQTLPLTFQGGISWRASVWCKADIGEKCQLFIGDANSKFGPVYENQAWVSKPGTGNWQQLSVSLTLSHDEQLEVYLYAPVANSVVIYDDVAVEQIYCNTPLCNGSFEQGFDFWQGIDNATITTTSLTGQAIAVSSDNNNSDITQLLPGTFKANHTYRATVSCLANIGEKCELFFGDAGPELPNYENATSGSLMGNGQWQSLAVTITITKDEQMSVYMYAPVTNSTVIYDNVTVEEITPAQTFTCANVSEIPQSECNALLALYNSTNGENWKNHANWLATNTPCTWYGVSCENGHVTSLSFVQNNLNGVFPLELTNLIEIRNLRLDSNNLTGPIPSQIEKLSKLVIFWLGDNPNFGGTIPVQLGKLTNITTINLANMNLIGSIPSELGQLTQLTQLYLHGNKLVGNLPHELGNLIEVNDLNLSSNQLTGPIPSELQNLIKLNNLYLNNNQLTGTFPIGLAKIPNLNRLNLWTNPMTGQIPPEIGQMKNLIFLGLSVNQMSGPIPAEICQLTKLTQLFIDNSQFSGPLPTCLSNLTFEYFNFHNTQICEPDALQPWLNALPSDHSLQTNVPCTASTPTMAINKTADKTIVQPGDVVNYTLVISASGMAETIQLTDTMPFGLDVVISSLPSGLSYDTTTRQLRYSGVVNGVLTLSYQAKVGSNLAKGSPLYNSVEATTLSGATAQWRGDAVTVVIPDPTFRETLVLIYLGIDNNLDKSGTEAITRLYQSCQANPYAKCWVVVDWKGDNNAYIYRFDTGLPVTSSFCPNAFNTTCNGQLQLGQNMWSWDEHSTSGFSLAEAMAKMGQAYPNAKNANQLIVSLVGHGGGWSNETLLAAQPQKAGGQPQKAGGQEGGLLYEENPLDVMSVGDLRQALTIAYQQTGHHIGLLYLDMCFMSNLESLHELTGLTDYVLASPNWAFAAFPYDKHIQAIDGLKDVKAIGQAWLNNQVTRLSQDQYPYTFSLIDMTKLPPLVAATEQLAQALLPHSQTTDGRAKIRQARLNSECFDSDQNRTINTLDYYCDLGSFAQQIQSQFSGDSAVQAATQAILTSLAQTVILEKHNTQKLNSLYPWSWSAQVKGISLFTPLAEPTWLLPYYNDYELKFAEDTSWDTMLNNFWQGTTPPTIPIGCTTNCTFPPIVQPPSSAMPALVFPSLFVAPNTTTTVPIQVINLPNSCLEAVNIAVQYDANIATFVSAKEVANMAGARFEVKSNQPGQLRIAAIVQNCQPFAGSGTLFHLTFQVKGALGQSTPLNFLQGISQTAVYDQKDLVNPLNLNLTSGVLTIANNFGQGDVNGDGVVSSPDAALALRQAVGKVNLDSTQQNACDVNGDSLCSAADVTLILCYAAQQDWSVCQQASSLRRNLSNTTTQNTTLCLSAVTKTGQQTLALKVTGAPDMAGGDFTLSYNPNQLTLGQLTKSSLTQNFLLESHEAISGVLKIALANNNPINADGTLLQLAVTAQVPTATLTLSEVRLNNRAGQDFATNLQRTIQVGTCSDLSKVYLPLIQR